MKIEEMTREQLIELAKKLPLTADGVPIWPGMTVYRADQDEGAIVEAVDRLYAMIAEPHSEDYSYWPADLCYSTAALAVAAREKREAKT